MMRFGFLRRNHIGKKQLIPAKNSDLGRSARPACSGIAALDRGVSAAGRIRLVNV
jgi:hypothetical protein